MLILLVINRLPPSPDRLFLGRSLFREDFVDVLGSDGYRVIEAIRIQADEAVGPDARDLAGDFDAVAFGNSLNHQPYLARTAQEARP